MKLPLKIEIVHFLQVSKCTNSAGNYSPHCVQNCVQDLFIICTVSEIFFIPYKIPHILVCRLFDDTCLYLFRERSILANEHSMVALGLGINLKCQNSRRNLYMTSDAESRRSAGDRLVILQLCSEQTSSDQPDWC